tara:strand:- start:12365 stop:14749 length:2385 start_codon:yes stop_codon:yes gene_type:complete
MAHLRKSPLNSSVLQDKPITLRDRKIIDINLLKQVALNSTKHEVVFNYFSLLNDSKMLQTYVYRQAKALSERLKDGASVDSEYGQYLHFVSYYRYCLNNKLEPYSKGGFLRYCSRTGELQRRIALANKPLDFIYLYEHGVDVGISEGFAGAITSSIVRLLKDAGVCADEWLRDVTKKTRTSNSVAAYSKNEYETLLRRLQLLFFSLSSQLIAAKEEDAKLEVVQGVVEEFDDGCVHVLELLDTLPKSGDINLKKPLNVAMLCGYHLFCHYTNLNTSSVFSICHPITETEYRKAHRTTRYVTVNAWKGRARKVVQGTFVESEEHGDEEELPIEVDKHDGIDFINVLTNLSKLFYPDTDEHPPLFYLLTKSDRVAPISSTHLNSVPSLLFCYADNRYFHAPYLVERFNELLEKKTITEVGIDKQTRLVVKKTVKLGKNGLKMSAINCAYAVLRALTNIPLKNILMPLTYSEVNADGNVKVTFVYKNGSIGEFSVESKYVSFLQKLEGYAEQYNRTRKSKNHPHQKLTPYLLPLGAKRHTYQWETLELPISAFLKRIGILSGEYMLDVNARRFRSSASNNNFDLKDGGVSVATSLLQNSLDTLKDHYLAGDITQNQIIASQAIDILHEYAHSGSLEDAKAKVKESRNIEVLEYDTWKALRIPTNPNGMLCDGKPTGEAKGEHRASQRRAKGVVGEEIGLKCYQFDKCIDCQSAKLVNDVTNAYKLLSFIELLEDSIDLMPEREEGFSQRANELMELAEQSLSKDVLEQAEDKLVKEGRYLLHNQDFLQTMIGVNCHE